MLLGRKILIVEDDDFIRELYVMYLVDEGYAIVEARNGQEGVDKFKSEFFDLVLLDILLPKKDGIEVLREIKEHNSKVPIVMLTNLASENMIKKSFELGAEGYLLKSRITKKDLMKEVKGFIEQNLVV